MAADLDRRTYDLLRLIETNEPIGSIRLVDRMQRRGYDIKGRTIRLLLSELDEAGLTEKVPGRGRRLTDRGRSELDRGDVAGRLRRVRERIATLTSQVTYDPDEAVGEVVACSAEVRRADLPAALDALGALSSSPVGPVTATVEDRGGRVRIEFPSSITLGGVLLSRGIDVELTTAGLVEYRPPGADRRDGDGDEDGHEDDGGDPAGATRADGSVGVVRYIDTLNGEGSTMDVVSLLIEAGRTDVDPIVRGDPGVLMVDNREFPLTRFDETADLAAETTATLGGVLDIRRPRESGPTAGTGPGWEFASLTYGGLGETALALLHERSLLAGWKTLDGLSAYESFEPIPVVEGRFNLGTESRRKDG